MTILADHPAHERDEDGDQIGLRPRLAAVLDILRHKETRCPITIAITGDWGTGKSSAMRWLAAQLKAWNDSKTDRQGHPCVYPVWFDPWKYQTRQDVWRGIIAEVILSLFHAGMTKENFIPRMTSAVKQFGGMLGRMLLDGIANTSLKLGIQPAEVAIDGKALSQIVEEYRKTTHPEKAYFNEFEQTLKAWIGDYLEGDSRLCLFIDDLDRCLPGVTLEVLEALKLYLNIPQLIFVVGLDRAVVDGVVIKHYRENIVHDAATADLKAHDYLNKIFQVEIQIAPSEQQLLGFFQSQQKSVNKASGPYWHYIEESGHSDKLLEIIRQLSRRNPREIKRLLNGALLRGRSAADDPLFLKPDAVAGAAGSRELLFAQGVQIFLLQRLIEERVLRGDNLLKDQEATDWFAALSAFLSGNPAFQPPQREATGAQREPPGPLRKP